MKQTRSLSEFSRQNKPYFTLVACQKGIDKQLRHRSWSGFSLFAIQTRILWLPALITNIFFANRKSKVLKILEHLPFITFLNLLLFRAFILDQIGLFQKYSVTKWNCVQYTTKFVPNPSKKTAVCCDLSVFNTVNHVYYSKQYVLSALYYRYVFIIHYMFGLYYYS